MEKVKPSRILLFILICFVCLGIIMLILPKGGVRISNNVTLKFPTFKSLFELDTMRYADIDTILNRKMDSTLLQELNSLEDSLEAFKKISRINPGRLNYPDDDKSVLYPFFEALEKVEVEGKSLRILHYGDSQIEMDRITGYVRQQLQDQFGGMGPGLQPPLQVIASMSVSQSNSGSWRRYACWGFDKSLRSSHRRYGMMLNFCELTSEGGTVTFSPRKNAYELAKQIQRVRVLVGNTEATFTGRLTADGKSYGSKQIAAGRQVQVLEWVLDSTASKISLSFSGGGTPEVYGIALDGKTGVSMDNLPMRGCSGTIFTRVDSAVLAQSYSAMDVKLVILEFGGNMMPSIKGQKNAERYGERFLQQINYIQRIHPDAAILVIGLADMSKRQNGVMQSYPYIENVRDELKKATFEAGGTYWDMFAVMGGLNSMPSWVEQGLAGGDYIHFTRKGAERISELFYEALINDYNEYRLQKRIDKINNGEVESPNLDDSDAPNDSTILVYEPVNDGVSKSDRITTAFEKRTAQKEKPWVTYTVKQGDSVWKISAMFGVSVDEIVELNGIDPDKINEGQVLKIKREE